MPAHDLKIGDYVLVDRYSSSRVKHEPDEWTVHKVIFVDHGSGSFVLERFRRPTRYHKDPRAVELVILHTIIAYGDKRACERYRAKVRREVKPLQEALTQAERIHNEADTAKWKALRSLHRPQGRL